MAIGDPINPKTHMLFTPVPDWLAARRELTPGAKLVYARLARYFNEEEGHAYPAKGRLESELGMPIRTIFDHLDRLHAEGLIRIVVRGRNLPNVYQFIDHEWRSESLSHAKSAQQSGAGSAEMAEGSAEMAEGSADSADPLQERTQETTEETTNSVLAAVQKTHTENAAAQKEARMIQAFRDLWAEHVGERAAKALTVAQLREAVDLWDRAIELGQGELIALAVQKAATDADLSRWRYFRRTAGALLNEAVTRNGRTGVPTDAVYDDGRYREWARRRDAGEELAAGVRVMLAEWEAQQRA